MIGLLALLEGELMVGGVSPRLSDKVRQRLVSATLLDQNGTERDLRQAINDLNHRLRYALGEYEEPPLPDVVPE